MAETRYIAIEGPIGVGKTTLARLIHQQLDAELLLEVFEENPFLSDFYADRAKYAFQTQIFFLLSRYRQQHHVISRALRRTSLVSDYTFAKDQLFAQLNLSNDELTVYDNLHAVLAQRIPLPDLVVYLRADLDVLMERIAIRDRSYERSMPRQYIADLIQAYERFFATYEATPLLIIDTNVLNIVQRPEDLRYVAERVKSALGAGTHQRQLPELEPAMPDARAAVVDNSRRRLCDLQGWNRTAELDSSSPNALYQEFLNFQATVGRTAEALGKVWSAQGALVAQTGNQEEAGALARERQATALKTQMADALGSLLRLANHLDINLEEAYLQRVKLSTRSSEV